MTGLTRDLILSHAFGLLMVLARVGPIFALLPGLGESSIPAQIKAGLILTLTLLLLPTIEPLLPTRPTSEVALAGMIVTEIANGLWFGWLARLVTISLPLAGQFIADVSGFANVLVPSADLGGQSSALASLYEVAVPALVLSTGLYQLPLTALVGFYHLVPAGAFALSPPWTGDSATVTIAAVTTSFNLALRLATPFILAAVGWNVAIGLLARLVPRMQIFFVALPGQIGVGLLMLALLAAPLLAVWMDAARTGFGLLPGSG
jgi:flagellar biosynthesis protein FliR